VKIRRLISEAGTADQAVSFLVALALTVGGALLASLVVGIALEAYLFYAIAHRRNEHYARVRELAEAVLSVAESSGERDARRGEVQALRASRDHLWRLQDANAKGWAGVWALARCMWWVVAAIATVGAGVQYNESAGAFGVFSATLLCAPIILGFFAFYHTSIQGGFAEHERAEAAFFDAAFALLSEGEEGRPSGRAMGREPSFQVYPWWASALLLFVTIGIIWWIMLYRLCSDPLRHFHKHRQLEADLARLVSR